MLGYKEFFPNEQQRPIDEYVELLGQDLMQKTCSHFLSMFRLNGVPPVEQLLCEFFTFNELKCNDVPEYHKVAEQYRFIVKSTGVNKFSLITVEPFLRMFMWLWQHPEVGKANRESSPENMLSFFKLVLIFNTKVAKDIASARKQAETYLDQTRYHRIQLAMTFPQSDFLNVDYMQLLVTQFYKAIELLNFISTEPDFALLNTAFLKDYNCDSKEEYFKSLALAIILPLQRMTVGWNVINVPKEDNFEKSCDFLEKIAVNWDEDAISDQNDYLPLRSNPLLKLKRGEYRVIYDSFLIKKMYNGLVFILSGLVKKDEALFQANLLGELRRRFSENILLYTVMQRIYGESGFKTITGEEFQKAQLKREPDYFMRDMNDIFLFESKDFYIKGKTKLSYNFSLIEPALKKDRLEKATQQLACNVARVFRKQLILDDNYDVALLNIYPIVIVHDPLYSCPCLNYWVNGWFQQELKKIKAEAGMEVLDMQRIMPLTIVEVDTLILYQPHFQNDLMNLKALLDSYHKQVDLNHFTFISKMQAENHALQSSIPFAEYVRRHQYDNDIEPNIKWLSEMLKGYGIN